ncbi:hypothetical protein BRD17_07770 [Halobacteriales archaeon SW_7_68_16]|nr:MAG: hypothetical protein BRD17_07770 [Halobacteriales archaeon SW_7_68_16]
MTDDTNTIRCWLVSRSVDDRDLVTLVYATPDGTRMERTRTAATRLGLVTAAREVSPDDLEPVPGADRDRYRREAARVADSHDPDDGL